MFLKKIIELLTLFFILLFILPDSIFASTQDNPKAKAVNLFEAGNFYQAIPQFESLLIENPDDPMLNYYLGAARTETGKYSKEVLNHLVQAQKGTPPVKLNYYLGLQYQAQSNWTNALKHYNTFQLKSSGEERKQLKVAEKIQQCFNQENPFQDSVLVDDPGTLVDVAQPLPEKYNEFAETEITKLETLNEISLNEEEKITETGLKNYAISFPVNADIVYYNTSNFKNKDARLKFENAQDLKNELDFSLNEMEDLRLAYKTAKTEQARQSIGARILAFENESYELKDKINSLLNETRKLENQYWQNASPEEIESFIVKAEQALDRQKKKASETSAENSTQNNEIEIDPGLLLEETETADLLAQPETKDDELIYKIQIGAYSRGLPAYVDRLFKKLSFIRKIDSYTDEKGVVVYTTGNLKNLSDAEKLKEQVRQEGAEDAFVVPYFNGKRITLEEAKKLETGQ